MPRKRKISDTVVKDTVVKLYSKDFNTLFDQVYEFLNSLQDINKFIEIDLQSSCKSYFCDYEDENGLTS